MNQQNRMIEVRIDEGIKNCFPDSLVVKRDKLPGLTTPVISWCIAPEPMENIEVLLSKYKNHLEIKKYICNDGNAFVSTIYSGPIPKKMVSPDNEIFDSIFIMNLICYYKFVALCN